MGYLELGVQKGVAVTSSSRTLERLPTKDGIDDLVRDPYGYGFRTPVRSTST